MDWKIIPAFDRPDEVRKLLKEYTDMLVEGDPAFAAYLKVQNFETELEHLEYKYGLPGGRFYLACCGEQIVGCIGLRKLDEENCEIKRLYVRAPFRRNGIGRRLTEQVVGDAREIGYRHVLLDTLPFLTTAIAMYKKMGFVEIESYNGSPMKNLVYLKLEL